MNTGETRKGKRIWLKRMSRLNSCLSLFDCLFYDRLHILGWAKNKKNFIRMKPTKRVKNVCFISLKLYVQFISRIQCDWKKLRIILKITKKKKRFLNNCYILDTFFKLDSDIFSREIFLLWGCLPLLSYFLTLYNVISGLKFKKYSKKWRG